MDRVIHALAFTPEKFLIWAYVTIGMALYFLYYAITHYIYRKNLGHTGSKDFIAHVRSVYVGKVLGIVFLGGLPLLLIQIFDNYPYNWDTGNLLSPEVPWVRSWVWLLILTPVILMITRAGSKRSFLQSRYPEIRMPLWVRQDLIRYLFFWAGYLLAYEFLFRYILFFPLMDAYGLEAAILINTGLYALAHVPKGKAETIGAIPLGIVLCIATYDTQTLIVAFFGHMVLASSTIVFCIHYNPETRLK